jgi:hypothetical protein
MAWSWGEKLNILQKAIIYFLSGPFKLNLSFWAIPINGIFWGLICLGVKI